MTLRAGNRVTASASVEAVACAGVTRSDLLVINKTDLAALVGADLGVMARDAAAVRDGRPVLFTSLATDPLAADVAAWVRKGLWRRPVSGA